MVNTSIRFAAKDGEALYSKQKQDQELTVAQTMYLGERGGSSWREEGRAELLSLLFTLVHSGQPVSS